MVDANNFDILQDAVREVLCLSNLFQGKNIVYRPANRKAKEIADKLMRARQKIAKQKAAKNATSSALTRYLSILAIGKGWTPAKLGNLTLFQLFDIMERYTAWIEWDVDLRVRLAGGKPDKQVESWMRDLHLMK